MIHISSAVQLCEACIPAPQPPWVAQHHPRSLSSVFVSAPAAIMMWRWCRLACLARSKQLQTASLVWPQPARLPVQSAGTALARSCKPRHWRLETMAVITPDTEPQSLTRPVTQLSATTIRGWLDTQLIRPRAKVYCKVSLYWLLVALARLFKNLQI